VPFFDRLIFGGDERLPRSHCVDGAGQAVIDVLARECRSRGIDIALRRRVDRLVVRDGAVVGASVGEDEVTARAVVVATGGFGAAVDKLAEYYPSAVHEGFTWYIGADGSLGDALGFADQVGARLVGLDRGLRTLTPAFGRLNEALLPGWTVLLDPAGRRFCDETAPYGILDGLVRNHGNAGFIVFDDAAMRPPAELADRYRDAYKQVWPNHPPFRSRNYNADIVDDMRSKGRIAVSDTLEGLAGQMGVDPSVLVGEIGRYNELCAAGDDRDYGKSAKYLLPLSTPPFYAAAVRPATVNLTGCGLRIDGAARVLDQLGSEIPGLYAGGECTGGVLGTRYMGSGNGMANALTMGRVAGESAAHHALAGHPA
jgi:succinate dehydrogenase/fumarate reductase flavoprotein subunit